MIQPTLELGGVILAAVLDGVVGKRLLVSSLVVISHGVEVCGVSDGDNPQRDQDQCLRARRVRRVVR